MASEYTIARKAQRELADVDLSDSSFFVCRRTGLTHEELWNIAGQCRNHEEFMINIGYSPTANRTRYFKWDNGYWARIVLPWCKEYVKQWFAGVRKFLGEENKTQLALLAPEERAKVVAVAAKALNIETELLLHFLANQENLEIFLEAARPTLGTRAEMALWELIMKGDPATVRWALPRLKPELFGDASSEAPVKPSQIRIIDV